MSLIKKINIKDYSYFLDCLKKSLKNIFSWETDSDYQKKKIQNLKE